MDAFRSRISFSSSSIQLDDVSYLACANDWPEQLSARHRIHLQGDRDCMTDAEQPRNPSIFHRAFYGPSELRAGWRLCIFLAIVVALINADNLLVRRVLHDADGATLFLVRGVTDFLIFLLASWIMSRMERRTIADYGLPWRGSFRVQLWQGVLLGFGSITALLFAMRLVGCFILEVGCCLRARLHPRRSERRIPRSWIRAIHAFGRYRLLASRNSIGGILRLFSSRQLR
jgi:hypothetical protein